MKEVAKQLLLVIVFFTIILVGCTQKPSEQINGKWYDTESSSWLEFFPNGTIKIHLTQQVTSDRQLIEKILKYIPQNGWIINIGYIAIPFSHELKHEALLRKENDKEIKVSSVKYNKNTIPWAKVVFSRATVFANNEEFKLKDNFKGIPIQGYKTTSHEPITCSVDINDKDVKIEGLSFLLEYMDLNLKWNGVLSANGLYKLLDKTNFDVYLPLKSDNLVFDFLIFKGNLQEKQIVLNGQSLGMKGNNITFNKTKILPSGTIKIVDTSGISGLQLVSFTDVDIIAAGLKGKTINRLQNIKLDLPWDEDSLVVLDYQ